MSQTKIPAPTINTNLEVREIWTIPYLNSFIVIVLRAGDHQKVHLSQGFSFSYPITVGYRFMKNVGGAIEMNVWRFRTKGL